MVIPASRELLGAVLAALRERTDGTLRSMIRVQPEGLKSFADAEDRIYRFEALLAEQGMKVETGSRLEHGCTVLQEMHRRYLHPEQDEPWANLRDDLREGLGVMQLIDLVVRHAGHPDFAQVYKHLAQLNEGSPAQSIRSVPEDQASNKVFELLVALAAMGTGSKVALDDPDSSDGTNPDVLATMSDGRRWGFACKVIHGTAPKSIYDRFEEGVGQVEKSEAEQGIVVFNFKNRLPTEALFPVLVQDASPVLGAHRDMDPLVARLSTWVRERFDAMVAEITPEEVWKTVRSTKALPGALVVVEAGVGMATDRGPLPSLVGFLQLVPLEFSPLILPSRFTTNVMRVLGEVNEGLRD